MIVLLVRHAGAGDRHTWEGDDRLRPLDKRGRKQAKGLVALLADYRIDQIASSPYVRCVQTVEPLAAARGLTIEPHDELAEGSTKADVLWLLGMLGAESVALCTHGDVVEALVGSELPKGSTQVLEAEDGRLTPREYLAPPSS
jgi:8-oxo-dGTP diphosphatase